MNPGASDFESIQSLRFSVGILARDQIHLELEVRGEQILAARLTTTGCLEVLRLVTEWRPKLIGSIGEVALPKGTAHSAILLRELLLKAQGKWKFPYSEDEICHCRAVPTSKVDAAIVGGCHSIDEIKQATSASTSCGTCRSDVEAVLRYRLSGS